MTFPVVIQGGMGAAVSDWRLARAVARCGQLGVVSGTGIDTVLVRRLQDGDSGGHLRRAMRAFPFPRAVEEVLTTYWVEGGKRPDTPYRMLPLHQRVMSRARLELTMLAAFVEVTLAREGHDGPIGINLLTKIQLPTLPTLYGAMLAGVDCVLMGAGIPREIPGALDQLARHDPARLRLEVEGEAADRETWIAFDPSQHWTDGPPAPLTRPRFYAIVASTSLATVLARKASGQVDGFVIEGPTAGGHNAPPRGAPRFNERGEPLYGPRDVVDLAKIRELGLPFWLAGGAGHPQRLAEALQAGAAGVQVGTLFAFCDESGLHEPLKRSILRHLRHGTVEVRTDPRASPTGYPFKIVSWPDDPARAVTRERVCDLGYLRTPYARPDGRIGYRCPGEPAALYLAKGGRPEDLEGRQCLCNALLAVIGHPQVRDGSPEPPIVTSGDDLVALTAFLGDRERYAARDVVDWLLG